MAIEAQKTVAARPLVAGKPVAATSQPAKRVEPSRQVDVANFRLLPIAGAPLVSAEQDATLGSTGWIPALLNKLEQGGAGADRIVGGVRFLTRVLGPAGYAASAYWNIKNLDKALPDKTISKTSKVVLTTGTGAVTLGAIAAGIAALPMKVASKIGLGSGGLIKANKLSTMAGGLAGIGFASINLVETLRNKDAQPAQRFFAKAGFGLGVLGFVGGTTALVVSMGAGGELLAGVLPVASKVATYAGIASMGTWIGQLTLGKNHWLNDKLEGTFIA